MVKYEGSIRFEPSTVNAATIKDFSMDVRYFIDGCKILLNIRLISNSHSNYQRFPPNFDFHVLSMSNAAKLKDFSVDQKTKSGLR